MHEIIEEVKGLYKVIKLEDFRKTQGVTFDILPQSIISKASSVDRVIHQTNAISPGPVNNIERPWYMHEFQDDNLVVLYGTRHVEIYTASHRRIENFKVTPNDVYKNGKLIAQGGAMLVWPRGVFHRIVSGEEGSASINFAIHYERWNIRNNFNIYDLNTESGEYHVIREGFKDQIELD